MAFEFSRSASLSGIKFNNLEDIPKVRIWFDAMDSTSIATSAVSGTNAHVALGSSATITDTSLTHTLTTNGVVSSRYDAQLNGYCWDFDNNSNQNNTIMFPKTTSGLHGDTSGGGVYTWGILAPSEFTIEFWINPSSFGLSAASIVYDQSTFIISILPDKRLQIIVSAYTGWITLLNAIYTTNVTLTANQWSHIAICKNASSNSLHVFLNGELNTKTASINLAMPTASTHMFGYINAPHAVVGGLFGIPKYNFSGSIANFRIWLTDRYNTSVTNKFATPPTYNNTNLLQLPSRGMKVISWKNKALYPSNLPGGWLHPLSAIQTTTSYAPLYVPALSAVWFDGSFDNLRFAPTNSAFYIGDSTTTPGTIFGVYHNHRPGSNSNWGTRSDINDRTTALFQDTAGSIRVAAKTIPAGTYAAQGFKIVGTQPNNVSSPIYVNSVQTTNTDSGLREPGIIDTIGSFSNPLWYGSSTPTTGTLNCEYIATDLNLPDNEILLISQTLSAKWSGFDKQFGIFPALTSVRQNEKTVYNNAHYKTYGATSWFCLSTTVFIDVGNASTSGSPVSGTVLPVYIVPSLKEYTNDDLASTSCKLLDAFVAGASGFNTLSFSVTANKPGLSNSGNPGIPSSTGHLIQLGFGNYSHVMNYLPSFYILNPTNTFLQTGNGALSAGWTIGNDSASSPNVMTGRRIIYEVHSPAQSWVKVWTSTNSRYFSTSQVLDGRTGWGLKATASTNLSAFTWKSMVNVWDGGGAGSIFLTNINSPAIHSTVPNNPNAQFIVRGYTSNPGGNLFYFGGSSIFNVSYFGVEKSVDQGASWKFKLSYFNSENLVGTYRPLVDHPKACASSGKTIIVLAQPTDSIHYRSIDGGENWMPLSIPSPSAGSQQWSYILHGNGVWLVLNNAGARRSYDDGVTWTDYQTYSSFSSNFVAETVTTNLPDITQGEIWFFNRRFYWLRYTDGDTWLHAATSNDSVYWSQFSVKNAGLNRYDWWHWAIGGDVNHYGRLLGVADGSSTTNAIICGPPLYI